MRSKPLTALGATVWFLVAPCTLTVLVPVLLVPDWKDRIEPGAARTWLAALLLAIGFAVLVECFIRFVRVGHGTPAPYQPPERLVISGLYRHVRNPMYVGVITVLFGEWLLLNDLTLLWFALIVFAVFHLVVLLYEEPILRNRYGPDYQHYVSKVPRWLPRVRPWNG